MTPATWRLASSLLGITLLCGCGGGQGTRAGAELKTMEKESRAETLFERARAFAAVGDYTRAEEYFAAAMENGGDPQKIIPLLLYCCMQDGRYRLAMQYAEEHLRRFPSDVRTRFVLGTLYSALEQPVDAERELRRVIQADPNQAEAHFALAKVLWEGRRSYAEADRHAREYLRLTPNGPHAEEAREHLLHAVPQPEEPAPNASAPTPLPEAPTQPSPL